MQTVLEPGINWLRSTLGTVVVTGGASEAGRAIAGAVAAAGGTPVTLDSNAAPGDPLRDHRLVDCGDRHAIETAIVEIGKRYGKIDAIVANTGSDAGGAFERVPADRWERVIDVNLIGPAALVRSALPYLERAQHPRIVTVTSTLGSRALDGSTAYCASMFGVAAFTRALARELDGRIDVTLIDREFNDAAEVAAAVVFALQAGVHTQAR